MAKFPHGLRRKRRRGQTKCDGQDFTRQSLHHGIISLDTKGFWKSPPQKVKFAIQIISGIFPGKVICVDHGKIVRHERAWCYREGVRNCARDGAGPPEPDTTAPEPAGEENRQPPAPPQVRPQGAGVEGGGLGPEGLQDDEPVPPGYDWPSPAQTYRQPNSPLRVMGSWECRSARRIRNSQSLPLWAERPTSRRSRLTSRGRLPSLKCHPLTLKPVRQEVLMRPVLALKISVKE